MLSFLNSLVNMRLFHPVFRGRRHDLEQFARWVLALGDGMLPVSKRIDESEATWIDIPDDLLIRASDDKIYSIVNEVFPCFVHRYQILLT